MFPTLNVDEEITTVSDRLGKVLQFDFTSRKFIFTSGKPVEASYETAIAQWAKTVLLTEQDKYKVYKDSGFGIALNQFIGRKDIPNSVIISEVKRQIEEQLTQHSEIESIEEVSFQRSDNKATISFNILTKNGTLIEGIESEVIFSG